MNQEKAVKPEEKKIAVKPEKTVKPMLNILFC